MTDTGCKSVPPLFWSFSPSLRRASFVVAKMVHGLAHKRRPPSRHVVDGCRTGFWDAEDEELPYAVGSSEDGALTAALVTRSEKAVCAVGIGAKTAVARSAV